MRRDASCSLNSAHSLGGHTPPRVKSRMADAYGLSQKNDPTQAISGFSDNFNHKPNVSHSY